MESEAPVRPSVARRRVWAIVSGIGLVVAIALLARWATTMRQSGVRLQVHAALHSVSQAAEMYRMDTGATPTLDDLQGAGLVDVASLRAFSRCEPATPGGAPALDAWLVQTVPCRAVRKAEPWNGPGETIDHDLPACRFVLMKDWTVVQIDEPDFQRDYAERVTLTPLKP